MLGRGFFEWEQRQAAAACYGDVVEALLDPALAGMLGADGVAIEEVTDDGREVRHHGGIPGGVVERRFLGRCAASGVRLAMWRMAGGFSPEDLERFEVVAVIVRCTLRRLCSEVYLKRMRERLFLVRRESALAIFVVEGNNVIPLNPGSVECAETWWGPDQLSHELTADQVEGFWRAIESSWRNPIEADWIRLQLDIGGGVLELEGMARHGGGALLIHTRAAAVADGGGAVPMLTRRQCGIMDWIAEGKTSAEVGAILEISPRTVEKHLEAVFNRFGVDNRVAAVRMYLDLKSGAESRRPVAG